MQNTVFATDSATRSFIVYFTDAGVGLFRDATGYVGLFTMATREELDAKVNGFTRLQGRNVMLRNVTRRQHDMLMQQLKRKQLCKVFGKFAVHTLRTIDK